MGACWGGGSAGTVDFGDLDVTISAPLDTGVFLSYRELQRCSECHQNIVIEGMEESLRWENSSGQGVLEFWNRTVSPSYFVGGEKSTQFSPVIRKVRYCIYLPGFRCDSIVLGEVRGRIFGFGFVGKVLLAWNILVFSSSQ